MLNTSEQSEWEWSKFVIVHLFLSYSLSPLSHLRDLVQIIFTGLNSPHQMVKNAALFSLGQFSEHLQVKNNISIIVIIVNAFLLFLAWYITVQFRIITSFIPVVRPHPLLLINQSTFNHSYLLCCRNLLREFRQVLSIDLVMWPL